MRFDGAEKVQDVFSYFCSGAYSVGFQWVELLSIGLINDMYTESRYNECKYAEMATQEDILIFVDMPASFCYT